MPMPWCLNLQLAHIFAALLLFLPVGWTIVQKETVYFLKAKLQHSKAGKTGSCGFEWQSPTQAILYITPIFSDEYIGKKTRYFVFKYNFLASTPVVGNLVRSFRGRHVLKWRNHWSLGILMLLTSTLHWSNLLYCQFGGPWWCSG